MVALASLALASIVLVPSLGEAQVPFAAGRYERWSSLFEIPSPSLAAAPSTTLLPEWVDVRVRGDTAIVTFEPDRRVVWRIAYGPDGATSKRVLVDGVEVLHAVYERDSRGFVTRKRVTGSLVPGGLDFTYTTDTLGRVTRRVRTLADGRVERLEVAWAMDASAVATTFLADVARRRDRFDSSGRLLETTLSWESVIAASQPRQVIRDEHRLVYRRDGRGNLVRVVRFLRGRRAIAAPAARDTSVTAEDLRVLAEGVVDRSEVRLLFGSPVTGVDRQRGAARELHDSYADGCWMNETDILHYDASGLYTRGGTGCICGLCVEASQAYDASDALGTELHWRRGPWLRLNGELVITGDHELATPGGPRRADTLRVGDLVSGADGQPLAITSVEALDDAVRLGRNVETEGGTFTVGRFVVVSEPYPMACPSAPSASP